MLCWRSGDHALVCDLRMRLVHLLRDAAHSPDARWTLLCEILYISCLFVIGARATNGGCWLPASVPYASPDVCADPWCVPAPLRVAVGSGLREITMAVRRQVAM